MTFKLILPPKTHFASSFVFEDGIFQRALVQSLPAFDWLISSRDFDLNVHARAYALVRVQAFLLPDRSKSSLA